MNRLLPLAALVLASCMPTRPPAGPNPGPEILAAVDLMYDDLSGRRWDALEAHFLPDASLVFSTPDGPRRMAPDKFVAMVREKVQDKEVFEERRVEGYVWAHLNMASVWSRFEGREGSGRDIREWSGIDSFTLVKVEGRWRISQITVSVNPK